MTWHSLLQIIALKAHFPKGKTIKTAFADYVPITTPENTPNLSLINIQWIAGLINAESSLTMVISKASKIRLGDNTQLELILYSTK